MRAPDPAIVDRRECNTSSTNPYHRAPDQAKRTNLYAMQKRTRLAGVMYLVLSAPAAYCATAGSRNLVESNDASATVQLIRGSATMSRACIAGQIVSAVGFLFVV